MRPFLITTTIGLVLAFCSCSKSDQSITQINNPGGPLMIMNLQSIKDSTKINFSDIATDIRIIRLETLPECLISSATYYITNNYILAKTKTAILQFDHLGKFIRVLATRGEGPREFGTAEWVVDEKTQRLILADEQKTGYFLYFDLKTGEYLQDIPKAIPGVTRKFALTAYGSLACVPYMSPGVQPDQYYLYWQDIQGKFLDAIKGPAGLAIYRGNFFEQIPEGYRYKLAHVKGDTIYTIRDKKLIPYLAFNHGEDFPDDMESEGYRHMTVTLETRYYMFLDKLQISNTLTSGNNTSISWTGFDYLLDKQQKKAFLVSGIYNDFIGAYQPAQAYKKLPNHIIYNALQAFELIGIAERTINSPKSDQKLIGRMKEIAVQINREDNPVLVIGTEKQ
jgi:hypothetical protein